MSNARLIQTPLLAIEHSADDAVPQPDTGLMFQACASPDKTFECIQGATHYFQGQPELMQRSVDLILSWSQQRNWC